MPERRPSNWPASKFPGGTLGEALAPPVMLADGGKDLYIQQEKFHEQFAADVPKAAAALMAAGQRPIAEAALTQGSRAPAWKEIPAWSIYGTADKNIPPGGHALHVRSCQCAEGGGGRRRVTRRHGVPPDKVAALMLEAAE